MARYPVTRLQVEPDTIIKLRKYKIVAKYSPVNLNDLGQLNCYNYCCKKGERVLYSDVIKICPNFDGKLTPDLMDMLLLTYKKLITGCAIKTNKGLYFRNPTSRIISKWATFMEVDKNLIPIEIDYSAAHLHIHTIRSHAKVPDKVNLSTTLEPKPKLLNLNKIENSLLENGVISIMNNERCREWFSDTIIVDVPGDGQCGAHAIHQALHDINIDLPFGTIVNELESIELRIGLRVARENSWWSAEALREFAQQIGVRLLIKDVSSGNTVYWWTMNSLAPTIGIWANGNHYQWCKKIRDHSPSKHQNNTSEGDSDKSRRSSVTFDSDSIGQSILKNMRKRASDQCTSVSFESNYGYNDNRQRYSDQTKVIDISTLPKAVRKKYKQLGFKKNMKIEVPDHFTNFVEGYEIKEIDIDYVLPPIKQSLRLDDIYTWAEDYFLNIHIPHRMDAPLIRLPNAIVEGIALSNYESMKFVHQHWRGSIMASIKCLNDYKADDLILNKPLSNDINVLKQLCVQSYNNNSKILSDIALECAYDFTNSDAYIISGMNVDSRQYVKKLADIPSYYLLLKTLRHLLSQNAKDHTITGPDYLFHIDNTGKYVMSNRENGNKFKLIGLGSLFMLMHESVPFIFIGTSTYLDYTVTYTEVKMSLGIIQESAEYKWITPFSKLFIELSESTYDHNNCVQLFKNFEALTLALSDLIQTSYVNWTPIIDTLLECIRICHQLGDKKASMNIFFDIFYSDKYDYPANSLFTKLMLALRTLTGTQLQEISSIHKFLFYAEVDQRAGIEKFLKRVHTKRPVEKEFIDKHLWFTRRQFVLSFIRRHNVAPTFLHKNAETEQIQFCIKNNLIPQLECESISWWKTVIPYNCLSDTSAHNVLEVAKDKGALLERVKMAPGDSRRELFQVIETKNLEYKELDLNKIVFNPVRSVNHTRSSLKPISEKYPTRLIPKEKEQKIEARLFGNATLANKHGLSYKMLKAKHALSYFDSEMMTKADRQRKLRLHEMAQLLNDADKYSLMLDIEGHNQSMQPGNCELLYEFVGLLYGESDWSKLAHYFSAQTVYMYDEFYDDVIVSKGQLGGIEGWYNPLWTLHTSMLVEMLPFETTIKLEKSGVYSDDVEMIITMENADASILNAQFAQIQGYFLKAGMIVRLSQTALSKNRVTLLRNHFFKGKKSDSTIKRILAASMMNNGQFISEEIEVQGICSTLSSALELSEHVLTSCFVKWYYVTITLIRLFVAYIERARHDILWENKYAPISIKTLIYTDKGNKTTVLTRSPIELVESFIYTCVKENKAYNKDWSEDKKLKFIHHILKITPEQLRALTLKDIIYKAMKKEKSIRDLLFLIAVMPTSVGGKGTGLLINDILSGHSDGFLKQIHYIHQWLQLNCDNRPWIQSIMEYMLRVPNQEIGAHLTTELCTNTWPTTNYLTTTTSMLKSKVTSVMKSMCINNDILTLFKLENNRNNFHKMLVDAAQENIQPRILQFYSETSVHYLLDLLIKKIETSSGFYSKIKSITTFRNKIAQNELDMLIKVFRLEPSWFPDLQPKSNILHQLVLRRDILLSEKIAINIEEPLYDHLIHPSDGKHNTLVVLPSSIKSYQDGRHIYKAPVYGNEALYKGEIITEDSQFDSIEEVLCAKLGAVTKWLLAKNSYNTSTYFNKLPPIYIVMCNISLSTITRHRFIDLFPYLPTNTGGEIFHRLPNMRYKSNAVVRSFPHTINSYIATINQQEINMRQLHDSNIHFDYLTQRMRLRAAFADKYNGYKPIVTSYTLEDDPYIVDVSRWSIIKYTKMPFINWTSYTTTTKKVLNFSRIKQIAFSFLYSENELSLVPDISHELIDDFLQNEEQIVISLLVQYHNDLRKNKMTLGMKFDKKTTWIPLIRQLQNQFLMFVDIEDEIILARLQEIARSARKNFIHFLNSKNKNKLFTEVKLHLNQCFNNELEFIGEYSALFGRLLTRLKSNAYTFNDGVFGHEYNNNLNDIHQNKEKSIIAYMYDIVINYCLVIYDTMEPIRVNRDETTNVMQTYFDKYIHIMPNAILNSELYYTLWKPLNDTSKNNIMMEIYNELDNELYQFDITSFDIPGLKPKYKPEVMIPLLRCPQSVAQEINYILYRTGLELFDQFDKLSKIFKLSKHACSLYSHPGIFESPTGSESYAAQYGLFKTLKERGIITNNTLVIDATAGRGDGHIALTELDIKHTSYARKDIYTAINHTEGIVFRDNYNIYSPSDLEFTLVGDHVHIDISWQAKTKESAFNIIVYLIKHKRNFSIRLNSLEFNNLTPYILDQLVQYRFMITVPASSTLCPYQVYLIGYNSINGTDTTIMDIDKTLYYQAFIKTYSELMTYKNLSFAPNIGMQNSVSILLDETLDPDRLCTELLKGDTYSVLKRNTTNALILLQNPTNTIMPIKYYEKLKSKNYDLIIKQLTNRDIIKNIYSEQTIVGGKSASKIKYWNRIKSQILDDKISLGYIELNLTNIKEFHQLQYDLPSATLRGQVSNLLQLIDMLRLQFPITSDQILTQTAGIIKPQDSIFDTTSKTVRDAILLLYYSACINNYEFGIHFMWVQFKIIKNNSITTFKILENYRKLSGLYHRFRSHMINYGRNFKIFDQINQYLIIPMKENQNFKTYHMQRANKQTIFSKENDEPVTETYKAELLKAMDMENFLKVTDFQVGSGEFNNVMSKAMTVTDILSDSSAVPFTEDPLVDANLDALNSIVENPLSHTLIDDVIEKYGSMVQNIDDLIDRDDGNDYNFDDCGIE